MLNLWYLMISIIMTKKALAVLNHLSLRSEQRKKQSMRKRHVYLLNYEIIYKIFAQYCTSIMWWLANPSQLSLVRMDMYQKHPKKLWHGLPAQVIHIKKEGFPILVRNLTSTQLFKSCITMTVPMISLLDEKSSTCIIWTRV